MPSRWVVALAGPAGISFPVEAPHAVVSRWLDVDHRAPVKQYAVSPPDSLAGRTVLTVRLLDDGLAQRLAEATTPGRPVRLGRHQLTIATPPECVDEIGWDRLLAARGRRWDVRFCSPTTFRNGNRTSPLPSPAGVLSGLRARWAAASPVLLPSPAGDLWVSDLDGRNEMLALRGTVVSGFVGRVTYACGTEDAPAYGPLLAFAAYAGIGSHTAFGLGTVEVTKGRHGPRA